MGSLDDLAGRAGVRIQNVAGLQLINVADVPALLQVLGRSGVRVVGAEGFHVEGPDEVRPAMDAILDLSDVTDPAESVVEAERFISSVAAHDLFFEFVVRGLADGGGVP